MLIGRRQVLFMLGTIGVVGPLLGAGPARANEGEPVEVVPEDSGGVPWT